MELTQNVYSINMFPSFIPLLKELFLPRGTDRAHSFRLLSILLPQISLSHLPPDSPAPAPPTALLYPHPSPPPPRTALAQRGWKLMV